MPNDALAVAMRNVRLSGVWTGSINARALGAEPLFIEPLQRITVNSGLLEAPSAVALVARYGFEWQIWRERSASLKDSAIDALALRAAAAYYGLLTKREQDQCKTAYTQEFCRAVESVWQSGLSIIDLSDQIRYLCARFRPAIAEDVHDDPGYESLCELAAPVEYLLICGGDERLALNSTTGLNAYGCRPFPRPDAFTFSSSTATSISPQAYARCEQRRQQLIGLSAQNGIQHACTQFSEELRRDLLRVLELPSADVDVILTPSGTDAELVVLALARQVLGLPLVNILTGPDETGRGIVLAAQGRHFNSVTSRGVRVQKGESIPGLDDGVVVSSVPMRSSEGQLYPLAEIDAAVSRIVDDAIGGGNNVFLHVVDQSKLGCSGPSIAFVEHLVSKYKNKIQIVVDACQLRTPRSRIKYYLGRGWLVIVTGSKFFTGPPLSGAILVPADLGLAAEFGCQFPSGLADYTSRSEWPQNWASIGLRVTHSQASIGSMFRWQAAIEELDRFFAVAPASRGLAYQEFKIGVSRMIAESGFLELLPSPVEQYSEAVYSEMPAPTIFPFFIWRNGKVLDGKSCDFIYKALNADISALLPASAEAQDVRIGARLCHIGQPVRVGHLSAPDASILRISAGARVVSDNVSDANSGRVDVSGELQQVAIIIAKIGVILQHWDALQPNSGSTYQSNPSNQSSAHAH